METTIQKKKILIILLINGSLIYLRGFPQERNNSNRKEITPTSVAYIICFMKYCYWQTAFKVLAKILEYSEFIMLIFVVLLLLIAEGMFFKDFFK